MRKRISPTLFALLLAAGPAFAQFEGVLEMKMTMAGKGGEGGGGGTMNVAVAKAGTRSEMNMQFGPTGMKMVMLQKNDTPDMLYRINDADKTYTEIDLAKMREMAGQQQNSSRIHRRETRPGDHTRLQDPARAGQREERRQWELA